MQESQKFASWKGRVRSVLTRALGTDHHLTQAFVKNDYDLSVFTTGTPDSEFDRAFLRGVNRALGIIDAAIFDLEQADAGEDAVDETAFDPDLWEHVRVHVEGEEWQKVASQTAIFVEDRIRQWSRAEGKEGQALVGRVLFSSVLGDKGEYPLGNQQSETEGWRALGIGFALALSNVVRHNIQKRDAAKQYAMGILGLGSLLLTQIKYQYDVTVVPLAHRPKIGFRDWDAEDKSEPLLKSNIK